VNPPLLKIYRYYFSLKSPLRPLRAILTISPGRFKLWYSFSNGGIPERQTKKNGDFYESVVGLWFY
jgi:hypothetical protein